MRLSGTVSETAAGLADVVVVARDRGARGGVDPCLAQLEQVVAVVSADVDRRNAELAVGYRDAAQRHIARVDHAVLPADRLAGQHAEPVARGRPVNRHLVDGDLRSGAVDPGVQCQVVLARAQHDDLAQTRRSDVRILGVVTPQVLAGVDTARRLAELDLILDARRQAGELVEAVRTCGGGHRGVVAGGGDQPVSAAADQGDDLPADARGPIVLDAVAVGVHPQPVAQARGLDVAGVDRRVVVARVQRVADGRAA